MLLNADITNRGDNSTKSNGATKRETFSGRLKTTIYAGVAHSIHDAVIKKDVHRTPSPSMFELRT